MKQNGNRKATTLTFIIDEIEFSRRNQPEQECRQYQWSFPMLIENIEEN